MNNFLVAATVRFVCPDTPLVTALAAALVLASAANAQNPSQLTRIEALNLEVVKVGRVTTYHAPGDRERAEQLARRAEEAAAFFERELGISFAFRLAALSPNHWFSPYGNDLPYGIPWASVAERLIIVPASWREGALIQGRDESYNRRMIEFVMIHEFGHIANKQYYHPTSTHEEFPVLWFEELVASYFAYAYARSTDPQWTELARKNWTAAVKSYSPRVLSLDWGFMRSLPGPELAQTYGWYQFALNLRVVDVHAEHGVAFLRAIKTFPVDTLADWTTESLLARLEQIAPGFQRWADTFQSGKKRPGNN